MQVFYRIAPNPPIKSPFSKDDKLTLVKTCLKSFIDAFKDTQPQTTFILDNCPEYEKEIKCPFKHAFIHTNLGNFGTYQKQIELASQTDDFVLLQEDDYLYLPNIGKKFLKALEKFDFVTPQDEYLYYFNEPRHIGKYEIKIVADHHFREVNSTTLTFATHSRLIKQNKDEMLAHGIGDYPMWQAMRERGYKIYAPIPTFATHLVEGMLAPTVKWDEIWRRYL